MKALIIGGGIGGLTTAIALRQKGIEAQVFEQSASMAEVGAGLWLAPNAMQVMNRLGLVEKLKLQGNPVMRIQVCDAKGKPVSHIDNEKDGVIARYGFPHLAMHRAALHKILYNELGEGCVLSGKHFESYSEEKDKITAKFSDGSQYEGDILIGADGLRSVVRKQMFGETSYRYSGQTSWRGISEMVLPEEEKHDVKEVWLNGAGLRAAYAQVNGHQVYFYATRCCAPHGKDEPGKSQAYLLDLVKGAPGLIGKVIEKSDNAHVLRTDLNDFAPIRKWHKGRAVLMGDAAHATTPNLGQGANQAIESAFVLAKTLAESKDVENAFKTYETIRMPKAHLVTNRSWQFGQISNYGSKFSMGLRNFIFRNTPRAISNREFEKIYALNY